MCIPAGNVCCESQISRILPLFRHELTFQVTMICCYIEAVIVVNYAMVCGVLVMQNSNFILLQIFVSDNRECRL